MGDDLVTGFGVLALLVGFPLLLLAAMVLLERLEDWMLQVDERATQVRLLLEEHDVDEIEDEVATMLADHADRPGRLIGSRRRRPNAN